MIDILKQNENNNLNYEPGLVAKFKSDPEKDMPPLSTCPVTIRIGNKYKKVIPKENKKCCHKWTVFLEVVDRKVNRS